MFDVVVVGGNLAGASAAIKAAEKGVSVALVERNKKPFFPAHCGEGIADITAELLNLDKIGCPKNEITNIVINVSSKKYTLKLKNHKMIVFDRNFVENKLLKEAEKKGVEVILGVSMIDYTPPHEIILDNKNILKGRVIIDASGIACQVGRRIGIDTRLRSEDIGVCIQSRVKSNFDADTMKFWHHKPYAPFGYAWLFPLNEKIANIGLGIAGGQKLDLSNLLKNYIDDMTSGKYEITSTFRACIPLASPLSRLIKNNVMIVGDAARLIHQTSGVGIVNALFSGCLAGIIAAKYIHGEIPSLELYQDSMQSKITRLRKIYISKCKVYKNEDMLLRKYGRAYSLLNFFNKFFPNLVERNISKRLEQDRHILESYNESPFLF